MTPINNLRIIPFLIMYIGLSNILRPHNFTVQIGCIRRTSDKITEDYDEIDRRDPPVFINNTRTRVVVAAGKTATLECRVMNIGDRTVSEITFPNNRFDEMLFTVSIIKTITNGTIQKPYINRTPLNN